MHEFLHSLNQHHWWVFTGLHLTLGRTASITYAVALGMNLWIAAPVAFAWDCAQVPLWWWLYSAVARNTMRIPGVDRWIDEREARAEHRRLWRRLGTLGDVGVVLLAALPFWGCGMWTSTLLAWTMGMRLTRAIWFLAVGGLIGLGALVALELGIKSLFV